MSSFLAFCVNMCRSSQYIIRYSKELCILLSLHYLWIKEYMYIPTSYNIYRFYLSISYVMKTICLIQMVLFHNIISITIWDLADRTLQYLYRSETWLHIKLCLNHSDNDMVGICVWIIHQDGPGEFLGENWEHYRVTLVCYWTARKSINVYI